MRCRYPQCHASCIIVQSAAINIGMVCGGQRLNYNGIAAHGRIMQRILLSWFCYMCGRYLLRRYVDWALFTTPVGEDRVTRFCVRCNILSLV